MFVLINVQKNFVTSCFTIAFVDITEHTRNVAPQNIACLYNINLWPSEIIINLSVPFNQLSLLGIVFYVALLEP